MWLYIKMTGWRVIKILLCHILCQVNMPSSKVEVNLMLGLEKHAFFFIQALFVLKQVATWFTRWSVSFPEYDHKLSLYITFLLPKKRGEFKYLFLFLFLYTRFRVLWSDSCFAILSVCVVMHCRPNNLLQLHTTNHHAFGVEIHAFASLHASRTHHKLSTHQRGSFFLNHTQTTYY